ncbi:hypothetical protein EMPS_01105 [Entomortierella parvispora]|uniref:C2H2-type domain-containing protein n=1 Tax=Entomortierella parvispora TaxID=205924 RepID=A0A9P3H283_9FUNG|nr:hypothetical protein EMPS_01105 [Entomortierella parvispora]
MESIPSPHSFIFSDDYICQWDSCLKNFDDAEMLYEHLRDDHVGRKAHHNLCLTCRWDKCSVPTFAKRDHITSHLRVHVASKPYHCDICRKGFKRPQDLKKHEKTHQEDGENPAQGQQQDGALFAPNTNLLATSHAHLYQPPTPPSYQDRSPSIASSTVSSVQSPYNLPLSPASMADSGDSWNPHNAPSPSFSTNSDLYSSPGAPDLELDMMNAQAFGVRPNIDVSGNFYGSFPTAGGYEDMVSPMSGKRARDGFDDLLSDTLGSFAMEAKKKRLDPSYNKDMMDRLNALQSILEVNPLTPDRLLSSLPDVNDWSQFNQLNQFCSTLFEDVSGEVFEPQTFDTPLFPDYEQKQTPLALDASFNMNNLAAYNNQIIQNGANNLAFSTMPTSDSIYKDILPEDTYANPTSSLGNYGVPAMAWDPMSTPTQGVRIGGTPRNVMQTQQPSRFNPNYVVPQQSANSDVKVEKDDEKVALPTVTVKLEERKYASVSTQTKAKQERLAAEGGMMMMSRPAEQKRRQKTYEPVDPDNLVLPSVPDTPLSDLDTDELTPDELAQIEDEIEGQAEQDESRDGDVTPTATNPQSSSRFGGYVEKALAKQAAAAAASAEPMSPVEAMTLQLERTRLDADNVKVGGPLIKPVIEGDMERQMRAAKARALCSQDPVRKQHAEVVLNLLKSIDALMVEHRSKVAQYKQAQAQAESGLAARTGVARPGSAVGASVPSMYPRAGVNVQSQGQIRTVSSYLPRRTPHQPSPLHQNHQPPSADPDYSQLRSSLTEDRRPAYSQNVASAPAADSPVLYPTSDLHRPEEEEPFELSEEERRFIEEDNAKTAAAQARYVHV